MTAPWPIPDLSLTYPWPLPVTYPWPLPDLSLTAPWPIPDRALTYPWPIPHRSLTYPWPLPDLSLTASRPIPSRSLTYPWPLPDLSVTSQWPLPDIHCISTSPAAFTIIATARVLPKATQRELFRLGAYPRYSQSHYWQCYFSELWFWSILGIIAHIMVSQVIAIFTESLQHKTVYNSLMDISHTYNSLSDVTIHGKMYYNCQRKMRQLW